MPVVLPGVQPAEEFAFESPTGEDFASASLEDVFRAHYPRLVAMLSRLTGDGAQAEEIASDVLCKLSRRGMLLRSAEGRLSWMYRVAMNAGLDAVRSNLRRRRNEQQAEVERLRTAAPGDALNEMLREEQRRRVQAVLATLKPRDAQLLLQRAAGLAYREIAQTLGIHPASVGTLLARAEAEFEKKYRKRYGDGL
jgi:RNA polymerase sigma-70 factor (ECF subfamily)